MLFLSENLKASMARVQNRPSSWNACHAWDRFCSDRNQTFPIFSGCFCSSALILVCAEGEHGEVELKLCNTAIPTSSRTKVIAWFIELRKLRVLRDP